ncbi:FHA domain-containing protein [Methanobrevibacter sp.]|uniref:FHA domain-containing protein n=1 Tax=Methanobrevibacter sp. TaxID=66852 RepID=UPI00388E7B59
MDDSDINKTVVLDYDESNFISLKLAAVNNKVRFSILEILRDNQKYNKNPLYSRELNSILLNNYNINITPQMFGQHMKKLVDANLVSEIDVKKEVPNKIGKRTVKAFVLKEDAFDDLFLEINFLSDELFTFFDLYKSNQKFHDGDYCVLTVFNGVDKGKTFKIQRDEIVLIGRKSDSSEDDFSSVAILLDNSYDTVSSISKPHLKLFWENDGWYIIDEASSNGTFIGDIEVQKGKATKLKSNSFLKLSRGNGGAVIYCSFE